MWIDFRLGADTMVVEERSNVETMLQIDLEETARMDECEILEFLRVAKEFPSFFKSVQ